MCMQGLDSTLSQLGVFMHQLSLYSWQPEALGQISSACSRLLLLSEETLRFLEVGSCNRTFVTWNEVSDAFRALQQSVAGLLSAVSQPSKDVLASQVQAAATLCGTFLSRTREKGSEIVAVSQQASIAGLLGAIEGRMHFYVDTAQRHRAAFQLSRKDEVSSTLQAMVDCTREMQKLFRAFEEQLMMTLNAPPPIGWEVEQFRQASVDLRSADSSLLGDVNDVSRTQDRRDCETLLAKAAPNAIKIAAAFEAGKAAALSIQAKLVGSLTAIVMQLVEMLRYALRSCPLRDKAELMSRAIHDLAFRAHGLKFALLYLHLGGSSALFPPFPVLFRQLCLHLAYVFNLYVEFAALCTWEA